MNWAFGAFRQIGDAFIFYLLGHEYAHAHPGAAGRAGAVHHPAGVAGRLHGRRVHRRLGAGEPAEPADGDTEELADGLEAVGDDPGQPWFAEGSHGTARQRTQAFANGYEDSLEPCNLSRDRAAPGRTGRGAVPPAREARPELHDNRPRCSSTWTARWSTARRCGTSRCNELAERAGGTLSPAARQAMIGSNMADSMRILRDDLGQPDRPEAPDVQWLATGCTSCSREGLVWRPGALELLARGPRGRPADRAGHLHRPAAGRGGAGHAGPGELRRGGLRRRGDGAQAGPGAVPDGGRAARRADRGLRGDRGLADRGGQRAGLRARRCWPCRPSWSCRRPTASTCAIAGAASTWRTWPASWRRVTHWRERWCPASAGGPAMRRSSDASVVGDRAQDVEPGRADRRQHRRDHPDQGGQHQVGAHPRPTAAPAR